MAHYCLWKHQKISIYKGAPGVTINTIILLKFILLVCIAQNFSIIFSSKAYGGSILEKEKTVSSGYLELLSSIQVVANRIGFT